MYSLSMGTNDPEGPDIAAVALVLNVASHRSAAALSTVALLAPALRLCPAGSAALAGRAAWLSALLALPPMLLYLLLLCRLMAQAREGEGLAELCLRLTGPLPGRLLLGLLAAWLLLYGAFVLRAGADRFVVTLFPRGSPTELALIMGLLKTLLICL